jgi:ubiquinone/menaquinone biosynthesis C-methylase UbiE
MAEAVRDPWARWVLRYENALESMLPTRDRVLTNARVEAGDVLLDVGAGSGLIAFGALPLVGERGRVIFSDVSQVLLDHCRQAAAQLGVDGRCEFLLASADDLVEIADASVDVVTTRSVLMYVRDKRRAFTEFYRVLRTGGRLSIFEPINSFDYPWPPDRFLGYDVGPVADLAARLMSVYDRLQPLDDPMLDFDERDLLAHAEEAGFGELHMTLEVTVGSRPWTAGCSWEEFRQVAGNPCVPPIGEVLDDALTPPERDRFEAHLRPLVERGEGHGRLALAFLWALKP